MRITAALLALTVVVACAPKEEAPADSAAAAPAAPAARTVADFAGNWNQSVVLEGTPDTVKSTTIINADGTGFLNLEGRPNIALTLSMSGDSLVSQTAEYESILRKGVMVTVRSASVMQDGMMMGNVEATYKTSTGTQVVKGTSSATKAP
jgi:hypothetical protein